MVLGSTIIYFGLLVVCSSTSPNPAADKEIKKELMFVNFAEKKNFLISNRRCHLVGQSPESEKMIQINLVML